MIEEDLFEQEIQKKKRRVLVMLVCLFVLAGGGFVARRASLAEEGIEGGTATPVPVAVVTLPPAPVETPAGDELDISEESDFQTPIVEDGLSKQVGEDAINEADGVGGAIDVDAVTPETGPTEEDNNGTVTNDDEQVAGDVESGTGSIDDGDADDPVVDDEDNENAQAGGEIGADADSGDEIALDDAGTVISEESATDPESISGSETDVDDMESDDGKIGDGTGEDAHMSDTDGGSEDGSQTGDDISPTDELNDENQLENESNSEDASVTDELDTGLLADEATAVEQDADSEQMTDFQPPPGQLPVTGAKIIHWGVAPTVAISLVILLVGAGAFSLFSSRHRRY